jgi:hypothetical protein
MRSIHLVGFVVLFIAAQSPVPAQARPVSDAAQDRLAGRVQSVDTAIIKSGVAAQRAAALDVIYDVMCAVCSYDPDGSRTFRGDHVEDKVVGTPTILVRDPTGHVIERDEFAIDGKLTSREMLGPFGTTEFTGYFDGAVQWRSTLSYDANGHLTEKVTLDGSGKLLERVQHCEDKDGVNVEDRYWSKNSDLDYSETQNKRTTSDTFVGYDTHGGVRITWSVAGGKLISFWEAPDAAVDEKQVFGEAFYENLADNNVINYTCKHNGECTVVRDHTQYLGDDKRLPVSIEVRDAGGKLLRGGYYEYELDSARNWTTRRVYLTSLESESRQLVETDTRTITYYPN